MFAQDDQLLVITSNETIQARVLQCFAPSLHDKVWRVKTSPSDLLNYNGRHFNGRWLVYMDRFRSVDMTRTLLDHASVTPGSPAYTIRLGPSHILVQSMSPEDLYDFTNRQVYTWVDGEGYRVK